MGETKKNIRCGVAPAGGTDDTTREGGDCAREAAYAGGQKMRFYFKRTRERFYAGDVEKSLAATFKNSDKLEDKVIKLPTKKRRDIQRHLWNDGLK